MDINHQIFYAITVHGRPTAPRKNRYDVALCYSDSLGTHVIRRVENTERHRKDEAISLFRSIRPGEPTRFVSVTSPYVVNKAEPIA